MSNCDKDQCLAHLGDACLVEYRRINETLEAAKQVTDEVTLDRYINYLVEIEARLRELISSYQSAAFSAVRRAGYVSETCGELGEQIATLKERLKTMRRQEKATPHTPVPEAGARHLNVTEN